MSNTSDEHQHHLSNLNHFNHHQPPPFHRKTSKMSSDDGTVGSNQDIKQKLESGDKILQLIKNELNEVLFQRILHRNHRGKDKVEKARIC